MKAYELLKINEGALKLLSAHSLEVTDVSMIPLIDDYMRLSNDGEKKTYVIKFLEDKYGVSERTIYRAIGKLMRDVTI